MAFQDKIASIYQCEPKDRENDTVVSDMDGTLLVGRSSFPYFALIAFDVGGILRLLLLLLAAPLAGLLYYFVSESAGIKVLIFVTFAGVKVSAIESAASAVLPKHYSEDLHPETYRVFMSCGKKCVLTANPRVMVEPFLNKYLNVDVVLGTEISAFKGYATGLVDRGGVLVGWSKAAALQEAFRNQEMPEIGIGDRETDLPFINLCKTASEQKLTVFRALLIILWFPVGIILSILRLFFISLSPIWISYYIINLLGCRVTIRGNPKYSSGVVFIFNHRTVIDALAISISLRPVPSFTEFISPIKTCRITRDRAKDAQLIQQILDRGELLVISPEGTTCREPYLLRFSALFAELADQIVPVAISIKPTIFHGSTARGHKWLDPFFLCMNPFPAYEITFLDMLSRDHLQGREIEL